MKPTAAPGPGTRKTARATIAILLAATILAAGCLDRGEEGSGSDPPATFWMVWVQGEEHRDPPPEYVCDVAFDHQVYPEEKRITYGDWEYGFDPATVRHVVAFGHWESSSDCPVAYTLGVDEDPVEQTMGGYGVLTLAFESDGTVQVDGKTLSPGQEETFGYEHEYDDDDGQRVHLNGTFTVRHLGAWPQDGLVAQGT